MRVWALTVLVEHINVGIYITYGSHVPACRCYATGSSRLAFPRSSKVWHQDMRQPPADYVAIFSNYFLGTDELVFVCVAIGMLHSRQRISVCGVLDADEASFCN